MYNNDFDMNQMELDPGFAAEAPEDNQQDGMISEPDGDEGMTPEPDGDEGMTPEPDGNPVDTRNEEDKGGDEGDGPDQAAETEAPPEKRGRTRRKKKEEEEPPRESEQPDESADEADEAGADDGLEDGGGELPADEVAADDGADEQDSNGPEERPARNVRPQRHDSTLDEYGRAVTQRQSAAKDGLNALSAASNRRIILTGTVDGIENDGNALPRVVFYVGGVKVLIPFSEMGFDLNPDEVDAGEAGRRIDAMLGAKIDYMVRRVDARNRIAAASRKDAMLLRQRTILNARSGDDYRIREGMNCTARVVQVFRNVMLVEVYGFQTYIYRDSVSHIWVHDIRDMVEVGEERPVQIVSLERDYETGEVVKMEVSMKAAEKEDDTELNAGNSYTATISGFSETAYFVKIMGVPVEVRCPIASNFVFETMDLGDTVKVVMRGLSDRGGQTGSIRKLIKRAESPLL